MRRCHRISLAATAVIFGCLTAAVGQVPIGPEFQVNVATTRSQEDPAIAADGSGEFVVVWRGWVGTEPMVLARRYDASASPVGQEFEVSTPRPFLPGGPQVAFGTGGGFVVAWDDVYARLFDGAGTPLGPDFQVNQYTTARQHSASLITDVAGNFVVLWGDEAFDGHGGVFGRMFDASGAPRGSEFQVSGADPTKVRAVSQPAGDFTAIWSSAGDGHWSGVFGRRYHASGVPLGPAFQVNSYTTEHQIQPSVSADASGAFVVVWTGSFPYGSGIFAQRFEASGAPVGAEFQVNSYTAGWHTHPAVAMSESGEFVVAWQRAQGGDAQELFGRLYNRSGVAQGADFPINAFTTDVQWHPAVAPGAAGTFVVAWQSYAQDGYHFGVFGRRFGRDVIFDDDFESGSASRGSATAADGGDLQVSAGAALEWAGVGWLLR